MSERKSEILAAAVAYVATHGIADLSLRPLAQAIGTSARLLIFHFESKEALVEEVLDSMQDSLQKTLVDLTQQSTSPGKGETTMKRFWDWASTPANLRYIRTLYEAHLIAARNPKQYSGYLERTNTTWLSMIAERLPPPIRDRATATLVAAVFDGLLLESSVSGERRDASRAMDVFIEMLLARTEARSNAKKTNESKTAKKAREGRR